MSAKPRRTESVLAGPRHTEPSLAPVPPPIYQGTTKPTDNHNPSPDLTIYNFSHEPWRKDAECRSHPDPGIFFPGQSRSVAQSDSDRAEAIALCRSCAVRWECLASSIRQPHGIFGGYDADERAKMKRRVQGSRRMGDGDLAEAVIEEGLRVELFRLKDQTKRARRR